MKITGKIMIGYMKGEYEIDPDRNRRGRHLQSIDRDKTPGGENDRR